MAGGFKKHIFFKDIRFACSRISCYRLRGITTITSSSTWRHRAANYNISDSQRAFQALRNPYPKSGQFLITQITLKVHEINISSQTKVTLE